MLFRSNILLFPSHDSSNYISKYILKSDFNHKEFKGKILCSRGIGGNYKNRLDSNRNLYKKNETKEYYVDKQVILTSAGIGAGYMKRTDWIKNKFNPNGETREYYKTETGHKQALPIYWRNKIYSEEEREKLWLQKLDKEETYRDWETDRKSTRLNSSHRSLSRMPSSA